MFALEVNKILQATLFGIEKGKGDVRENNIRTSAGVVLYYSSTRCTYASLEPIVPGAACLSFQVQHAWYLVRYMQAPNRR